MALDAPLEPVVVDFAFDDPFVNGALAHTDALVERYSALGFHGDTSINLQRVRRGRIDHDNPSTALLCREFPGTRDWLALMPTAAALDPLYDPHIRELPSGVPLDGSLTDYFCNLADARGIRSRAAAYRQVAVADALTRSVPARWLSLACGAAHPSLQAISEIRAAGGQLPRMTLVDIDPRALALAARYAEREGVVDRVEVHRMNVLGLRGFEHARPTARLLGRPHPLQRESFDMVEAIGILEYLRPDDWVYRYNRVIDKRRVMAGARTFLRHAWELVAPGGHLVIGNMLTTHPQLAFTLNVIQWPHIQPRDVPTMLDLLDQAGVQGDRRVVLPSDGVYALYTVQKPLR